MKDFEKNDGLDELRSVFSEDDFYGDDDDVIDIIPKKKAKSQPSVEGPMKIQRVSDDVGRTARPAQSRPTQSAVRPASRPASRPATAAAKQTPQSRPAQGVSKVQERADSEDLSRMFSALLDMAEDSDVKTPVSPRPAQSAAKKAVPVSKPAPKPGVQSATPAASRTQTAAAQPKRTVPQSQNTSTQPKARPQGTAVKPQSTAQAQGTAVKPKTAAQAQNAAVKPKTAVQAQSTTTKTQAAAQVQSTAVKPKTAAPTQTAAKPQSTASRPKSVSVKPQSETVQSPTPDRSPLLRPTAAEKDPDFIDIYESPKPKTSSRSRKKGLTAGCVIRRSLLVFFTVLFFAVGVLFAVCNTLANGPSQTARDKAVMSALQASATKWVPGLFLPDSVVEQIKADSAVVITDVQPITSVSGGSEGEGETEDRWANAIDGMIYENVNGTTFKGYVLLIKDPARVSVAVSSNDFANATMGKRIFEIADEYNAVAAINAGEFRDDGGVGTGYAPMGLTYSEGECVWNDGLSRTFMGFTDDHKLYVAEGTTYKEAEELGIRDAVSFQTGNTLITNDGENVTYYYADSNTGVAQRTAIGQCADGTVIFLVTDGRTASSMGATKNEIIDTLASYGAVTAGMLDGGSSSMLYYRDYYEKYDIDKNLLDEYQLMGLVNKYKAFTNPRRIPTFFIVNP